MSYKKYEIEYYDEDIAQIKKLSILDLSKFFKQCRGFPSILCIGGICGEGQSGGSFVSGIAKNLESKIIEDVGIDEYKEKMDKLMKK